MNTMHGIFGIEKRLRDFAILLILGAWWDDCVASKHIMHMYVILDGCGS